MLAQTGEDEFEGDLIGVRAEALADDAQAGVGGRGFVKLAADEGE